MADFTFVMNPVAGKGAARKADAALERLLRASDLSYEIVRTEYAGHATALTRSASSPIVVAVGGDGTVNEVANELVGSSRIMGIMPTGSGNDFVKSVGIPRSLRGALDVLKRRATRRIDVGRVSCGTMQSGSMTYAPARYFVNGIGTGFDAEVAQRVSQIQRLTGTLLYLTAVLQTLGVYKAPYFHISVDGRQSEGKRLLIATGNGKCAGGGFYLTPEADVSDGLLDFCMIQEVNVVRILRMIPAVMSGRRVNDPHVAYERAARIQLESPDSFCVHADGEVIGLGVNAVRVEVVPASLTIIGGN
jgi:YegS/Rv2252/BmrU family lipid kinase